MFNPRNLKDRVIYLDNAATTLKPCQVINAVTDYYSRISANVHRSPHRLGAEATDLFEASRWKIADFIGAGDPSEVIFTHGTTESLNIIAQITAKQVLKTGEVILLSPAEHHSNIVPWQMAAKASGATVEYTELTNEGYIDPDSVKTNWNPRTKIFAFHHVSNVLGTVQPVKELCRIAREHGASTVVDGAQAMAHLPLNVKELDCDFYAFSGHKMLGPTGIGVLWGRKSLLNSLEPVFGGGEMIDRVSRHSSDWNVLPYRFEPGTPNIAGAIGLGAAVDYLSSLGMEEIHAHIENLTEYTVQKLSAIEGVSVQGPVTGRAGAVSFTINDVHPHDIASILDMEGIAIRAGHHCAQPLMEWLGVSSTARASFGVYNTFDEADLLAKAIGRTIEVMCHAC